MAVKSAGKKISWQTFVTETVVLRDDEADEEHKRVVFINNYSQLPVVVLYSKKEKAAPMSHLWIKLRDSQLVRDQTDLDVLGSFLTEEEKQVVELKNNAQIFPELVTSKAYLRSKANAKAAAGASRTGGIFCESLFCRDYSKAVKVRALMNDYDDSMSARTPALLASTACVAPCSSMGDRS